MKTSYTMVKYQKIVGNTKEAMQVTDTEESQRQEILENLVVPNDPAELGRRDGRELYKRSRALMEELVREKLGHHADP